MPELPEVELTRESLQQWTVGRRIARISADPPGRVEGDLGRLVGAELGRWERRGKLLIGWSSGALALLSHLGMTGKWVHTPGDRPYQRLRVTLDDGAELAMIDPRRLGWHGVLSADDVEQHPRVASLGLDALGPALDADMLARLVGVGRVALKTRLMDQGRVAGLGNICAIEACHRARIHPHRPACTLSTAEWRALHLAIRQHIADTLAAERGREIVYVTGPARRTAPNPFGVYGRAGEPCPRCGAAIVRSARAGRPTFSCPSCQARPDLDPGPLL